MTTPNLISPADLLALRKLDAERTPGEWKWHFLGRAWILWCNDGMRSIVLDAFKGKLRLRDIRLDLMIPFYPTHPDAAFIAAASTALPRLLDTVEALHARMRELEGHEPERLRKAVEEVGNAL